MVYFLESTSLDPRFNLALEQYALEHLDRCFMLWRNNCSVIIGKHQNTISEVNDSYVREQHIPVVRRLSGGGAVFHDSGNINFSLIGPTSGTLQRGFTLFCEPVIRLLASLGVQAELSGRNDMTIAGRKFSGTACYREGNKSLYHGTLLYDVDLEKMVRALSVSFEKLISKGVQSVRGRVVNLKTCIQNAPSTLEFMAILREVMFREHQLLCYELSPEALREVTKIQRERYDVWDWNYGKSPQCQIHRQRRVDGFGTLEIFLNTDRGRIQEVSFFGDYFTAEDPQRFAAALQGQLLNRDSLQQLFDEGGLVLPFEGLDTHTFLDILLG